MTALFFVLALCSVCAGAELGEPGSLDGVLTDVHSRPLVAARVILRNPQTGGSTQAITSRSGNYHFEHLVPGTYSLDVDAAGLGAGHVDGIVITAGFTARVRTAVDLEPRLATMEPRAASIHISTVQPPAPPSLNPEPQTSTATLRPIEIQRLQGMAPAAAAGMDRSAQGPANSSVVPLPSIQAAVPALVLDPAALTAARTAALLESLLPPRTASNARGVELNQPELTATIAGEQLETLPLNGRHWEAFVLDTPAAATSDVSDEEGGSNRGARPAEGISMEGASTKLAFGGRGTGRAGGSSLMGVGGNELAIEELQAADRGAGIGGSAGPVNLETRSGLDPGTGRLRGQVFLFDRQNLWGAKNPFTQLLKETTPATATTIPVFTPQPWSPGNRRETFGLGAGGVLKRNKLFWFGAFDGDLRDNPAVSSARNPENFFAQPTNDEMQVLSARLGLNSSNPVAEGLAAYSPVLVKLDGLLGPAARTSKQWSGFGRFDWKAGDRHQFTLEATGVQWNSPGGGMAGASENYGTHSFGSSRASELWMLGRWQAFLTRNLLSVMQGSMGRQTLDRPAETPSAFEQTLNASVWGQLPQIVVDSRYGFTIGNPARFGRGSYPDEHLYEAREDLDWVHGRLLVRGGFELRHNADATSLLRNHTGTYHYTHLTNFASDALAFEEFGLSNALNPANPHNCDQRGKAWRDTNGQLHGLGNLPCYSYYTQTLGPTDWHLETNDWAGFGTAQWQPSQQFVLSAGLRWEFEQMPPPIALVNNPDLPLTQKLPNLGSEWGPRASLAWGVRESHWPVLRMGYGMYFGRTLNSVLESALTQTGSLKGDLNLFIRPMDGYNPFSGTGSAPIFPYVLAGDPETIEKPGAVELAPAFRNGEIHQAIASIEESLPGRIQVSATATASLGRRLPVTEDTNIDSSVNPKTITYAVVDASGKGPIKTTQITVPFFATWPSASDSGGRLHANYQQISELVSRANSTYEAATLMLSRSGQRGLSFHMRYSYAHAMDWNPNESTAVSGPSLLDPNDFRLEYGTSNLDVRHSLTSMVIWKTPWRARGGLGSLANGWTIAGIGQFHSGLPFTMRTAGSIPEEFTAAGQAIVGLGPGINGYGGDDRLYSVGRNTYRYPQTWKADVRLGKQFRLSREHELELMAESFNLFNHQNVTQIETIGYSIEPGTTSGAFPTLNFLTGLKTGQTEFGQPLNINATDFYRERQIDFGARYRF